LRPLVVHDNYLINLAAPDAEIDRALAIGAEYLVKHPGSSRGQPIEQAMGTLAASMAAASSVLGLSRVPVIHANDSKAPLASHVDRHENIGKGYISKQGFRRILHHPKLRGKAFILETPIDKPGDDRRNLNVLKRLAEADKVG
jgi:endonuclease IV